MSKIISGKKPISSKPKRQALFSEPDFFKNKLDLSDSLKIEISAQGLEYRWIDYKKYVTDGGMHSRGWEVYRRPTEATGTEALAFGNSPDGIIRRGSTVLAVRSVEKGNAHRAWLNEKNRAYKGFKKTKAAELRDVGGSDLPVDDSFDGDEDAE